MLVVLMRIDERSGAQGRSRRKWSLGEFVYDRSVADRFETQFFQAAACSWRPWDYLLHFKCTEIMSIRV